MTHIDRQCFKDPFPAEIRVILFWSKKTPYTWDEYSHNSKIYQTWVKIDWIKNSSSLEQLFSDNHEATVFSITVTAWSLLLRDEGSGLIRGWERAIRHRTKGGEGLGVSQRLQSVGVGESSGYLEQYRLSYGSLIMYTILVLQYRCRWYSEPLYLLNIATCSMNHIMNV